MPGRWQGLLTVLAPGWGSGEETSLVLALELAPTQGSPLLAPVLEAAPCRTGDESCRGGGQGPGGFPGSWPLPVPSLQPACESAEPCKAARLVHGVRQRPPLAAPGQASAGKGGWTRGADGGRGTYLTLAVRMRPACCKPVRAMYIRRISLVPCGQHYPGQRAPTSGQP